MLLFLLNNSVIKLLRKTISFFTLYIRLDCVNYTYRGYFRTLLTKLQHLLIQCDLIYDKVFLKFPYLPLRYEVPDLKPILHNLSENTKLENIYSVLQLNIDVQRYIHICEVVCSTVSQNISVYDVLCKNIFRSIPEDVLHLIMNVVDYKERKRTLQKFSDSSGLLFDIQYPNCQRYGDTFYNELNRTINDIHFKIYNGKMLTNTG